MGFIRERKSYSQVQSCETAQIASRPNVEGASATRILTDDRGRPVYGREVPVEFGLWPREIPTDWISATWSHRWLRLECRFTPPAEHQLEAPRGETQARLELRQEAVKRAREGSATRVLVDALRKLGATQRALGCLDDALLTDTELCDVVSGQVRSSRAALSTAKEHAEAAMDSLRARELLATCLADRGATLYRLGRGHEAREVLLEANEAFRNLSRDRPKSGSGLVRGLGWLEKVLEELGSDYREERDAALTEAEERGSLRAMVDTLIVAEVPLAGRRRCDRSVFRPGLHRRKPDFGRGLAKRVKAIVAEVGRTAASAEDALLSINLAQRVLEALEDPKIVTRDPFNTDPRVLTAGISTPSAPFWEAGHDYTPNWSASDANRTGWVLGVCSDAAAVHAKVVEALQPTVELAELGQLWLAPPRGRSGPRIQPRGDIIGKPARCLAPWAAWQAMAGTHEPVRNGMPVAAIAWARLNDLLYNEERKIFRANKANTANTRFERDPQDRGDITPPPENLPLPQHRNKIEAFLETHKNTLWAREGMAVLARCESRLLEELELHAIQRDRLTYSRKYPAEHGVGEVGDFVERWLRDAVKRRFL